MSRKREAVQTRKTDEVGATLLGDADSRRVTEAHTLRMISHPIVGCATLTEQLKKGGKRKM